MRGFIILCLASVAVAAPQAYNYAAAGVHQPHQHYGPAVSGPAESTFVASGQQQQVRSFAAPATISATLSSASYQMTQPQPRYLAPAVAAANSVATAPVYEAPAAVAAPFQFSQYQSQQQQQQSQYAYNKPAEAIVSKRFFIHSAPEEEEEEIRERYLTIGQARKNYNVVFIKAPVKTAAKTSIKITPATNEDKTVIYVLAKKPEESEVDAQVLEPYTTTAKPEVFFIKYKTAEEAAHAQQTIQAQYDGLGGSTQVSNEGTAPVSSVIGVLDAAKNAAAAQMAQAEQEAQSQFAQQQEQELLVPQSTVPQQQQQQGGNNAYLPPRSGYQKK